MDFWLELGCLPSSRLPCLSYLPPTPVLPASKAGSRQKSVLLLWMPLTPPEAPRSRRPPHQFTCNSFLQPLRLPAGQKHPPLQSPHGTFFRVPTDENEQNETKRTHEPPNRKSSVSSRQGLTLSPLGNFPFCLIQVGCGLPHWMVEIPAWKRAR